MYRIVQLRKFKEEIQGFPLITREDLFSLIFRYLSGEKLNRDCLKIFKIDDKNKILEFRTKDQHGNWRVFATVFNKDVLVLIYAFHKKSQRLMDKEKTLIRNRIKRFMNENQ